MSGFYLALILRVLNFLRTSDLFEVQRATLAKEINPTLLSAIEFLVESVDVESIPGAEKKGEVKARLETDIGEVGVLARSTAGYLINKAIEFSVAKIRS